MPKGALRTWILACALAVSLSGAACPPLAAAGDPLPAGGDLAADAAAAAATGRVVIVFYSLPGCPWCHRVREQYLKPLPADPAAAARILLREVDVESDAPLVDFDGHRTTQRAFVRAREVRVFPTLTFHGAGGEVVAEPLVGFTGSDFYGGLLDRRIEVSLGKVRR